MAFCHFIFKQVTHLLTFSLGNEYEFRLSKHQFKPEATLVSSFPIFTELKYIYMYVYIECMCIYLFLKTVQNLISYVEHAFNNSSYCFESVFVSLLYRKK